MKGYIKNPIANKKAFYKDNELWYLNLGDIAFFFKSEDGFIDIYWVSRQSGMIIKGGANYSCQQINDELYQYLKEKLDLDKSDVFLYTTGVKIKSEHEDTSVVIELKTKRAISKKDLIINAIKKASPGEKLHVSIPDYILFDQIQVNFKGAILVNELQKMILKKIDF